MAGEKARVPLDHVPPEQCVGSYIHRQLRPPAPRRQHGLDQLGGHKAATGSGETHVVPGTGSGGEQRNGDRRRTGVQRNTHVTDRGSARPKDVSGAAYPVPDVAVGRRGEALGQNSDPQTCDAGCQATAELRRRAVRVLAAVVSVGARHYLGDPSHLGHATAHDTQMIMQELHAERARMRDQAMRWLQACHAAPAGWQPHRSALISAKGDVDHSGGNRSTRARGGPAS